MLRGCLCYCLWIHCFWGLGVASGCSVGVLCWVGTSSILVVDCFFSGLAMGLRVATWWVCGYYVALVGLDCVCLFPCGYGCLFCDCSVVNVI